MRLSERDYDPIHQLNTLRPRQNGRHFADDFSNAFPWIKVYEFWLKCHWSLILRVLLTIFHAALVQIMAWRRPGGKPLSEAMIFRLLTHLCVTRPQWFKLSSLIHINVVYMRRHCNAVTENPFTNKIYPDSWPWFSVGCNYSFMPWLHRGFI